MPAVGLAASGEAAGFWNQVQQIVSIPIVMWLLITIGLVGLIVELLIPGHIISGAIGLFALLLYFSTSMEKGSEAPIIFIIGLIFILIELFIPGFGVFGILGILALLTSIAMGAPNLEDGIIGLGIGVCLTAILLWVLYRFFGFKSTWSKLVLTSAQQSKAGYVPAKNRSNLMGKEGITVTPLRPAGWANFDGKREDVVSNGSFIPSGVKVEVIHVEGSRVVVRPKEDVEENITSEEKGS